MVKETLTIFQLAAEERRLWRETLKARHERPPQAVAPQIAGLLQLKHRKRFADDITQAGFALESTVCSTNTPKHARYTYVCYIKAIDGQMLIQIRLVSGAKM